MIYRKAIDIKFPGEPHAAWGNATIYVEIADDHYATRHVVLFENGWALRYDRINWLDGIDSLAAARYAPARWRKTWGQDYPSDSTEFNNSWVSASKAPNQPQSYLDYGPWPILRRIQ